MEHTQTFKKKKKGSSIGISNPSAILKSIPYSTLYIKIHNFRYSHAVYTQILFYFLSTISTRISPFQGTLGDTSPAKDVAMIGPSLQKK